MIRETLDDGLPRLPELTCVRLTCLAALLAPTDHNVPNSCVVQKTFQESKIPAFQNLVRRTDDCVKPTLGTCITAQSALSTGLNSTGSALSLFKMLAVSRPHEKRSLSYKFLRRE